MRDILGVREIRKTTEQGKRGSRADDFRAPQ